MNPKNLSVLEEIVESLNSEKVSNYDLFRLEKELQEIKKYYPGEQNLGKLFYRAEKQLDLFKRTGSDLQGHPKEYIQELFDEIKVHIMSAALSAKKLSSVTGKNNVDWSAVIEEKAQGERISLRFGYGNLTYAAALGKVVILLPPVTSRDQCFDLLAELSNVFDFNKELDWVVDFSLVDELPAMMIASLVSYKEQLNKVGREVSLVWVKENLLPQKTMDRFSLFFSLKKSGQYYFSTF